MEGTKVLYLRVSPSLHNALIQEAAARCAYDWQRPNVQATVVSLLTDALTMLKPAERAGRSTKKKTKKGGRK